MMINTAKILFVMFIVSDALSIVTSITSCTNDCGRNCVGVCHLSCRQDCRKDFDECRRKKYPYNDCARKFNSCVGLCENKCKTILKLI
uniref:Hypotheticial protein n=1 Tax=Schistosoma japonicum TaxID=6182 RepID=C1LD85_SCHJA|nr:hypotheticial protein [Schistosoma japonicum]